MNIYPGLFIDRHTINWWTNQHHGHFNEELYREILKAREFKDQLTPKVAISIKK